MIDEPEDIGKVSGSLKKWKLIQKMRKELINGKSIYQLYNKEESGPNEKSTSKKTFKWLLGRISKTQFEW